jgi:uncharacterized membrane protein YhfC
MCSAKFIGEGAMYLDFKTIASAVGIILLMVSAITFFTSNYNIAWGFAALGAVSFSVGQFRTKA